MPSPGASAPLRSSIEDSYLELLADTLESLDVSARGQFLQRYFKIIAHIDLPENQCAQLWDDALAHRSELSQHLRSQGWYGVAVSAVQPGSRPARAGLGTDDVVIGVGSQRITSLAMLRGVAGVKPRQLVLVVTDGSDTRYVVVN